MSKDKLFGAIIFVVGILLIVFYFFWGPLELYLTKTVDGGEINYPAGLAWLYKIPLMSWEWAVVIPLFIVVLLVGVIAVWIGYSMITTPPPVPLEELEEELEAEEAASAAAEKKE
jgi:fatty acid desaturase